MISGATEDQIAVPLRLRSDRGVLSFWSATLVFGGPLDVTVSELMLETFLPADAETLASTLSEGRWTHDFPIRL